MASSYSKKEKMMKFDEFKKHVHENPDYWGRCARQALNHYFHWDILRSCQDKTKYFVFHERFGQVCTNLTKYTNDHTVEDTPAKMRSIVDANSMAMIQIWKDIGTYNE